MAKGVKGSSPKNEEKPVRTSFIIDTVINKKLNYIALMDDRDKTEIVNEAFTEIINKWEKKNGKIPLK